jgi:2-polyprenyl-6-methoxyphenol hydroxylase-like FAD-dependent oxidoreductase
MGGMLAARVLSDFYDKVVILERDDLSNKVDNRRGVPQGWHAHGLLASGSQTLEDLFPGISKQLIEAGALSADIVNEGRWFFEGGWLAQVPSGTIGLSLSRPFLENGVRLRVRELERVDIVDRTAVRDLVVHEGRVTGVITDEGHIEADLVVDASGRGSQSPKWLRSLGYSAPEEETVEVRVVYTTRYFRRRTTDMDGDMFAVVNPSVENPDSGVILAQENDRWVVTLIGRFGVKPPEEIEGFIEFAKGLNSPLIYDVIRNAEPVSEAFTMRFPTSVRRRYEELKQLPEGLLVFGDAICSFNPAYGQGISVASLQSAALQRELSIGISGIAARFYKTASKLIDIPWQIAVGSDLKMPQAKGKRTATGRFLAWYIAKLHKLGQRDATASIAFLRVAQLLDEPSALLRPKLVLRVLTAGRTIGIPFRLPQIKKIIDLPRVK